MKQENWREIIYQRQFNKMVKFIRNLRQNDPHFTLKDLEGMLKNEYHREGMGWDGRSEVIEIMISANIAALQDQLLEWKKEKGHEATLP